MVWEKCTAPADEEYDVSDRLKVKGPLNVRSPVARVVPLVVPLTLIGHHVRRCAVAYLQEQTYLDPHPKELMLRNHV